MSKRLKNILLITIPIAIVLIAVAVILAVLLTPKVMFEEKEISIRIGTDEKYVLGTAVIKVEDDDPRYEAGNPPNYTSAEFKDEESKKAFVDKILSEKDVIAEFTSERANIYYFIDEGEIYEFEEMKNENRITFSDSSATINYGDAFYLTFPMIQIYFDNKIQSEGDSVSISYDKMMSKWYTNGYKNYEDYKAFFERANKNTVIARIDDANKKIIVKTRLMNGGKEVATKQVELTFGGEGMTATYLGEDW